MKSILVTGGSGFFGTHLAIKASLYWKTYVLYNSNPIFLHGIECIKADITNKDEVIRIVQKISPDVIIHSAALINLIFCENNQEIVWRTNVLGTANIAMAAELTGAKIIYISTDQVFNGNLGNYSEVDRPDPKSYYGKTKLEGENIVASTNSNYCIARLSLLYGWSLNKSKCFSELIIGYLKEGKKIDLFTDEYRTPIYINNACEIICDLAKGEYSNEIYHISGSQRINRYEFGLLLADIFNLKKDLIIPVAMNGISQYKDRPRDCSLNNKKVLMAFKSKLLSLEVGLKNMKYYCNPDI